MLSAEINGWMMIAETRWFHVRSCLRLDLGNRSKAMSITTSMTYMCNFVISLATPSMLQTITWGIYIFFAVFCLLALAFTFFFIPEAQGKSLEDMDVVFGDTGAHGEKTRLFQIAARPQVGEVFEVEKYSVKQEIKNLRRQHPSNRSKGV
jgi:hypothetical protein